MQWRHNETAVATGHTYEATTSWPEYVDGDLNSVMHAIADFAAIDRRLEDEGEGGDLVYIEALLEQAIKARDFINQQSPEVVNASLEEIGIIGGAEVRNITTGVLVRRMASAAVAAGLLISVAPTEAAAAGTVNTNDPNSSAASATSLSSTVIFNGSATQTPSTADPVATTTPESVTTTTQPNIEQSPSQQTDEVMVFGAAEEQAPQDVKAAVPVSNGSNQIPQATEVTGLMRVFEQTPQGAVEVTSEVDAASKTVAPDNKQEGASSIAELLGIQAPDVFTIPNPENTSVHGTKVKAMSYNVLGARAARIFKNGGDVSWRSRLDAAISVIKQSNPDVIGFQEVDDIQYVRLNKALSNEYDTFPAKRGPGSNRMISWRASDYKLVDSGMYGVERYKEKRAQFPWVKLRSTETGEEFLVTNVHTTAGGADDKRNFSRSGSTPPEQRAEQAEKLLSVLDKVNKEKLPVMIIGDFNSTCEKTGNDRGVPQEKIPCRMLYAAGYQDAGQVANAKGDVDNYGTSTSHGKAGATRRQNARHIDHVMVSEGIEIRGWKNIIDELSDIASDHTPVEVEAVIDSTDGIDKN